MKFTLVMVAALVGLVSAQSCAGGAGFCDGSGHCQDGSGAVSPDVDPECVGGTGTGSQGGARGGRRPGVNVGIGANRPNSGNGVNDGLSLGQVNQGAPCAGGGFCDGAGHCQDGSGAVSSDIDPDCFA
ncbi:hypothetical protein NM208_g5292 [Fusarium decemcellulare]|uniref:Uncharacterized protein n=1 Tax=Fusarium decemcellulare TaxID=57161 RepID=A0ACC1SHK1_9HYPO|nr:hypothetical protein NM208_g5292 [Fusarium decemcellulare]